MIRKASSAGLAYVFFAAGSVLAQIGLPTTMPFCPQVFPPPPPPQYFGNPITLPYVGALDIKFHDFDSDGFQDLIYYNSQVTTGGQFRTRVYKNNLGTLPPSHPLAFEDITLQVFPPPIDPNTHLGSAYENVFFDVDGDGDADMVSARLNARDLVFIRDGDHFISVAEIDPNEESPTCCCSNGGTGGFTTCTGSNFCNRRFVTGIAVADIDFDGDTDYVVSHRDERPSFFLNRGDDDGDGIWDGFVLWQKLPAPPGETPANGWGYGGNGTRDIYLADLDHDGDKDVIAARMQTDSSGWTHSSPKIASVLVYRNDGFDKNCDGVADGRTPFVFWYKLKPPVGEDQPGSSMSSSLSIEVADVDGDGDYDVLQPILMFGQPTRIYLNDGSGNLGTAVEHRPHGFVEDYQNPGGEDIAASLAEVIDVDHDGDYDVVLAHHQGTTPNDRVFLNVGTQSGVPIYVESQDIQPIVSPNDNTRYIRFADLDRDGDYDYCEANFDEGAFQRVFLNNFSDNFVNP